MKQRYSKKNGFTLLELMLVVGMLVVIASISKDFYGSFVSDAQLEDNAKTIIYDLRNTRDKAMNGEVDRLWGIHFVNDSSDYYEIFSTPTNYTDPVKEIVLTVYLRDGIIFSSPDESSVKDVIFNKITGETASSSLALKTRNSEKIIYIKEQGLVN